MEVRSRTVRFLDRLVASPWAPWLLLAVVVVVHVLVTLVGTDPFKMVDLDVYVQGADHLTDGNLYDFVTYPLELPFTYPPFSALVFTPLGWLPWTLTRVIWQVGSFGALALIIYLTLRLLGRAGPRADRPVAHLRGIIVTGTALSVWLEPVRTTFNYGQINLFLAALLLAGAVTTKDWWAGTTVGLAAGIKLVPALAGVYYLLQRRFAVVVWAIVSFGVTVAVMLAIIPSETWRYFTSLIFDPSRTGPVWSVINQSWRGALGRIVGHDVSTSWLVACAITAVLGLWATWAALQAGDRTAGLLAIQFTGLLVSPISWSHHWVWVLPLLLWCFFGPRQEQRSVRVLAWAWLIATYSYVVSLLIALQVKGQSAVRPGWQSWVGTIYVVIGMATLVVVLVVSRRAVRPADAAVSVGASPS